METIIDISEIFAFILISILIIYELISGKVMTISYWINKKDFIKLYWTFIILQLIFASIIFYFIIN